MSGQTTNSAVVNPDIKQLTKADLHAQNTSLMGTVTEMKMQMAEMTDVMRSLQAATPVVAPAAATPAPAAPVTKVELDEGLKKSQAEVRETILQSIADKRFAGNSMGIRALADLYERGPDALKDLDANTREKLAQAIGVLNDDDYCFLAGAVSKISRHWSGNIVVGVGVVVTGTVLFFLGREIYRMIFS